MKTKTFRRVSLLSLSVLFCLVLQAGPAFGRDQRVAAATIRTLNNEISDANERQDLPAALKAAEKTVQVAKTEFGDKSLEAASAMNNLANLYLFGNRASEAEGLRLLT